MPPPEIRETILSTDADGTYVQLQVADVPLPAEDAAIRLTLAIRVPVHELPLVAHLQRAALKTAIAVLVDINERLDQQMLQAGPQVRHIEPANGKAKGVDPPVAKLPKARKPPTPPQPKPWDVPPLPEKGAPTLDAIHLEVGRALSAWERLEGALAGIFGMLVDPRGGQLAARRAYGSVLTFRGRTEMIEAAAEAAFWLRSAAPVQTNLAELLLTAGKFSARRNEIAHGIGGPYSVGTPPWITGDPGFVLGPPSYATNKTDLKPGRTLLEPIHHAPKYAYSDVQIDAFTRRFALLATQADGVWFDLVAYLPSRDLS